MKKRVLSLLLALVLLVGLLPTVALAQSALEGDTNGNGTVDVTMTITDGTDGFYQTQQKYWMLKQTISVPYFDLALYGLEQYYYNPNCYTGSTQQAGTKETAEGIVTTMHAMIYATEKYVMGLSGDQLGTGYSIGEDYSEDDNLFHYISWSQGAGSSFMSFWNGSTNLNYYLDYQYPLGREGWGSTSDQQALTDGMSIDIHFIEGSATGSQYSFFETTDGTRDFATVTAGTSCTLTLKKTTSSYGTTTQSAAIANETVYYTDATAFHSGADNKEVNTWTKLGETGTDGKITVPNDLTAGTYYLSCMGADEGAGERGPAAFVLTVQDAGATATTSIKATALSKNVAVDNTVEVAFAIANNPGIETDTTFTLTYDTEKLEFLGLKTGEGLLTGATVSDNTVTAGTAVSGDGKLFTAQFKGKSTGVATVSLSDSPAGATVTPATVKVIPAVSATSVTLSATEKALAYGETFNLSATVKPDDATDQVVWTTNASDVATVSPRGIVTGVGAGKAIITATAGMVSATCEVTVEAEESLVKRSQQTYGTPDEVATLTGIKYMEFKGKTEVLKNIYTLHVTGYEWFYLWASGSTAKAYKLDGTQCFGGDWGERIDKLLMNYSSQSIWLSDLLVDYDDLAAAVGTSNAAKLKVTEGNLLAFLFVNEGTFQYGILFEITPVAATGISIAETLRLEQGKTGDLSVSLTPATATDTLGTVTWESSNTNIATVDSTGKVTAVAPGETTITATMGSLTDTCTVTVTKPPVSIPVPSNGSWGDGVTGMTVGGVSVSGYKWEGFDLYIYTDDETGTADVLYTVEQSGTSTISKTVSIQNYEGSCETPIRIGWDNNTWRVYFRKNVPATSLELNKTALEVFAGDTATVTATLSEGSTSVVSWKSSDDKIATVDQTGVVTGVAEGTATITATAGTLSKTCTVKVKPSAIPAIPAMDGNVVLSKIALQGVEVKSAVWDGYTLNVTLPWNTQDGTEITAVFTVKMSGNVLYDVDDTCSFVTDPGTTNYTRTATIENKSAAVDITFNVYDIETYAAENFKYTIHFTVAEKTAVDTVIEQIDALPETITLEDESAIAAARTAYDALSAEQKELVTNYQTLTNAEEMLAALKKAKADQEAAEAVMVEINAIGKVTLNSKTAIRAAREAYEALNAEQQALVTNYQVLVQAERTCRQLVAAVSAAIAGGAAEVKAQFPFTDVAENAWYYDEVKNAWENGLIDGMNATEYRPDSTLTVAQAIKLAAALHQMDNDGKVTLKNGAANWYDTYVDYAVYNGIIESKYASYTLAQMNAAISRAEFVHIFHGGMTGYYACNQVADNAIPDVKSGDAYAAEIYEFYRAGILTGSDGKGTFNPASQIKRSEVAAILIRMYDTNARQSISLG